MGPVTATLQVQLEPWPTRNKQGHSRATVVSSKENNSTGAHRRLEEVLMMKCPDIAVHFGGFGGISGDMYRLCRRYSALWR
ncbi:Sterol-4-alpha-carboxylate 3-dehydrogenase, decarboxylating [Fusarium oxysporum f. sp. albedinis]|nr:Sterol-4-alpha-carboxylate 3-dehydrogenase, decarboxylating [Fusarium oxysporum f. sp. albedinis]